MPLESLLQLVETLRERIITHRAALSQSEALTRYALIDPLLRELGWDTEDPAMVIPEYRSGAGRADYALIAGDRPVMMIEAKKLGENLNDRARSQGIQHCVDVGTRYFSVTDGGHWEIYDTHIVVPIDEKLIVEFDLSDPPAAEACRKALALWKPGVESGQIAPSLTPLVNVSHVPQQSPQSSTSSPPSATKDDKGWQPLSRLDPMPRGPKPMGIQYPDFSHLNFALKQDRTWSHVMVQVTRWLAEKEYLNRSICPILSPTNPSRYILNTEPIHPDGSYFNRRAHKKVESFYIITDFGGSTSRTARMMRTIVERTGQDPAQFKVRFS